MRRSLAQSWRGQRRAKNGDLAWEESLGKKRGIMLNEDELLQRQRGVGIRGKSFRCILKIFLAELYVAAGGFEARLHEKIARCRRKGFQLSASFRGFVCLAMQGRDADAFTQNGGA